LPLKATLSTVCGSAKSRIQPRFGQTCTLALGTPQKRPYMTDTSTSLSCVLKPSACSVCSTICASLLSGAPARPTTWIVSSPVYLPDG